MFQYISYFLIYLGLKSPKEENLIVSTVGFQTHTQVIEDLREGITYVNLCFKEGHLFP